jgi:hypothetical protein
LKNAIKKMIGLLDGEIKKNIQLKNLKNWVKLGQHDKLVIRVTRSR